MSELAKITVADCGDCNELFVLPDGSESELLCPGCGKRLRRDRLQVHELKHAQIAPPASEPVEEVAPPQPVEPPQAAPTLADWLQRDAPPETTPGAEAEVAETPEGLAAEVERLLGSTLGPGEATIGAGDVPPSAAPADLSEPASYTDFQADFTPSAPLEEVAPSAALPPEESQEDHSIPLISSLDGLPQEPRRRGWAATAGVATLLGALGAGAYFFVDWQPLALLASGGAPPVDAQLARNQRHAITNPNAVASESSAAEDNPIERVSHEQTEPAPSSENASTDGVQQATYQAEASTPLGDRYGSPPEAPEPNPFAEYDRAESILPFSDDPEPTSDAVSESKSGAQSGASVLETPTQETPRDAAEEPVEPPAKLKGIAGAPSYPIEDLAASTQASLESLHAFTTGSLSDEQGAAEMGRHYAQLCYHAQVLTLFNDSRPGGDTLTTELEGSDIFRKLFRNEQARADSREIAGPWVEWGGRPHGGVFFAGVPYESDLKAKYPKYRFELGDTRVTVVSDELIDVKRYVTSGARQMGIIGVIVEQPSERLIGYDGDEPRVIWARKTIPLTQPSPH